MTVLVMVVMGLVTHPSQTRSVVCRENACRGADRRTATHNRGLKQRSFGNRVSLPRISPFAVCLQGVQ